MQGCVTRSATARAGPIVRMMEAIQLVCSDIIPYILVDITGLLVEQWGFIVICVYLC